MTLPLPASNQLPSFGAILPEEVEPAIDQLLAENRAEIARLLAAGNHSWEQLVMPLEALNDRLDRAWSPVSHLNAVKNSEALRAAYNACLPKLSAYYTELGQDERLYAAYRAIQQGPAYGDFSLAQRAVIEQALRDFHLAGVDLPAERKVRFKQVRQELSQLSSKYGENLLDATHGWELSITDEARLAGLPESARGLLRQYAQQRDLPGWCVTLEFPSYQAVMTYAEDRALRQELYIAYATRASDQGPNAGRWDNSELMEQILALRHEMAGLLGYHDYAELSLATKMAESTDAVLAFLTDLAQRSRPLAEREMAEISAFAEAHGGPAQLAAWDVNFWAERLRQAKFQLSQEELRPYFPVDRVLSGMFETIGRLFGVGVREVAEVERWHDDVRFFEIVGEEGGVRGRFYLDLFARPHKRGGAWMDECAKRRRLADGTLQIPVAYLVCNFTPPTAEHPALLTHTEVETLFHEFGHGLHHMLTQVDFAPVSGINGVPWDAVELPSQFMENFCWEQEPLALIAGHYQSGAPLPDALYQRMRAAKHFQAGMQTVRQLEFALFDFRLHRQYEPQLGGRIQETVDAVRAEVAVVPVPAYNRMQHSFSHIFAGGYAAGYYSYKWAEVLSADAFSRFEEEGVFNPVTGRAFLQQILEQGGAQGPMELFVAFRGRKPTVDALLRHNGVAA